MLYLSQVLGRPILDLEGERVATLKDVIVRLGEDDHPPVAGFVARYRRRDFFLPRWRISNFGAEGVRLNSHMLDLRPFVRHDGEVPARVDRMRGGVEAKRPVVGAPQSHHAARVVVEEELGHHAPPMLPHGAGGNGWTVFRSRRRQLRS